MISSHALDLNVEIHSRARTRVREGLPKVQNLDNHRQAGCPLHSIFTASPAHLRLQKGQPHTEVLGGKLHTRASLVAPRVKRLPAAQETRVRSPGQEDSPGEGNGNPLQYSCLENPMDGGAWWATVHGVAKSQTPLRDFTFTFAKTC